MQRAKCMYGATRVMYELSKDAHCVHYVKVARHWQLIAVRLAVFRCAEVIMKPNKPLRFVSLLTEVE